MTTQHGTQDRHSPIADPDRFWLWTQEFAADPHHFYREMRRLHPSLAKVEISPGIPATLVIGYSAAVKIGGDEARFPADPRVWQTRIPDDDPMKAIMMWRPNALRNEGTTRLRYRESTVDAIDAIPLTKLHAEIERIAIPLINSYCSAGKADLISQFALPLTAAVLNDMHGCPADIGQQVGQGMAMMFEGDHADQGNALFTRALGELVYLKQEQPAEDLTTRLVYHPTKLDDEELVHQLVTMYGAGIEPLTNLIANTLLLMLRDDRFQGNAALTTRDALNELLFKDPPLANFNFTYPKQPMEFEGFWLPAHEPVVISMAACNNDPVIAGDFHDNNSHLAWGTGPHACPARNVAYMVAHNAIDQLFDALPEIELACPAEQLTWRSGPCHRSLESLPVTFPASAPLPIL